MTGFRAIQGDGQDPTDFHEFLDAEGTIYLLGKDSEVNSVAPLTTAVTEDLLDIAETHAIASPAGRLDPPLLAALDEAPNIAPIPSLRQRVADGRGRGITVRAGRPPVPDLVRTQRTSWRRSLTTSLCSAARRTRRSSRTCPTCAVRSNAYVRRRRRPEETAAGTRPPHTWHWNRSCAGTRSEPCPKATHLPLGPRPRLATNETNKNPSTTNPSDFPAGGLLAGDQSVRGSVSA